MSFLRRLYSVSVALAALILLCGVCIDLNVAELNIWIPAVITSAFWLALYVWAKEGDST